ncbi:putative PurR-regulated permease PerM [Modicisalibacter xianhensis]|uniref:Putative PurR-regulated permease PerM n=1 Tax=Modicisalibacter xianhensis TaxID=442341 RepID=A0A4R8FJ72_9GAMM|nr:AI-2E family transporter [Halomonas xianhensis]TDX26169.1 putative PurR-regulated permease PerM [Halomonas xianhensis]
MSSYEQRDLSDFRRRVWIVAGVATLTLSALAAVWFGYRILMLIFAGLLLALFFSIPATWLQRHTFLSQRWALAVVLVVLAGLGLAFGFKFAMSLNQEFAQLTKVVPGSLEALKEQLRTWPLGSYIVDAFDRAPSLESAVRDWSSRVSTLFSTTFGVLLNVVVVVFIGLFAAFEPSIYRKGLMRLIYPSQRPRIAELLMTLKYRMSWWLIGRLSSMTVIGVLSGVGLWLLDIPMAFTLGLLAGLLSFIPYLGPVMSAVPALLVAFSQSPTSMLHVAILYLAIQFLESYAITPLIQREAVSIPPALLLAVQVWLGLFAGLIGLLIAEPLIVLCIAAVQKLYVEDWVERQTQQTASGPSDP